MISSCAALLRLQRADFAKDLANQRFVPVESPVDPVKGHLNLRELGSHLGAQLLEGAFTPSNRASTDLGSKCSATSTTMPSSAAMSKREEATTPRLEMPLPLLAGGGSS